MARPDSILGEKDLEIKVTADTKEAINDLNIFNKVLDKLGVSMDDFVGKFELVSNIVSESSKGIKTYSKTLKAIGKEYTKVFTFSGTDPNNLSLTKAKVVETPQEPKKKRVYGLAKYKDIAKEAELVSTRTQIMADGTRRTVELFRIAGEEGTTTYEAINKKIVKVNENLAKNNEEQEEANKKQSTFSKLWSAFKRITFYRTIRRAIQLVTQGLGQGLTNLREYDKELDTTLKSLSNAGTALKNSFASALGSLLKTVEPLVVRIADGIANITNRINEAKAVMSGATTYTKILTSDTEEWKQQLEDVGKTLLSFDKFESLEKQQYTGTVEAEVGMTQEEASGILDKLKAIKEAILAIGIAWGTLKITNILSDISKLSSGLSNVKGILGNLEIIIGAVGLAIGAINIAKIIENWNSWSAEGQKVAGVILGLTAVVASLAVAIYASTLQWAKAIAIGGLVVATGTSIALALGNHLSKTKSSGGGARGLEDGGIPPKSELFYMNEYGKPEALVNTGGTQTNVINIDQLTYGMKQGFVQAIYETGLLDAMQSTVVVEGRNIDNNAVARGLFNALKTESQRRGGNQL